MNDHFIFEAHSSAYSVDPVVTPITATIGTDITRFSFVRGAVTKLIESVKNIEKNFDSTLGFENVESSDQGQPAGERSTSVFQSFIAPSISSKTFETILGASTTSESTPSHSDSVSKAELTRQSSKVATPEAPENSNEGYSSVETDVRETEAGGSLDAHAHEHETQSLALPKASAEADITGEEFSRHSNAEKKAGGNEEANQFRTDGIVHNGELPKSKSLDESCDQQTIAPGRIEVERTDVERSEDHGNAIHGVHAIVNGVLVSSKYLSSSDLVPPSSSEISHPTNGTHAESGSLRSKDVIESQPSRLDTSSQGGDKIEKELKMMEAALLGAAKQAQSKADEISRLMLENEQLKASLEELKVTAKLGSAEV
ncbi:golgin candidate 5-like [Physcomitrium patens]|uniref:golgin candidate 5-like n=1 Tax=Physcomitrium patens TaxID=3218 RepID=UPI003CCE175F